MPLPLPLIIIDECTLHEHKPAELSQKSKNRWNLGDWSHRNSICHQRHIIKRLPCFLRRASQLGKGRYSLCSTAYAEYGGGSVYRVEKKWTGRQLPYRISILEHAGRGGKRLPL